MLSGLLKSLPSFVAPPLGPVLPSPRRSFFLLVSTWPTPFQKNLFHVQFTSSFVRTFLHDSDGWLSGVQSNKKLSKKHQTKLHRKSAFWIVGFLLAAYDCHRPLRLHGTWKPELLTLNKGRPLSPARTPSFSFSETLITPTEQHVRYQTMFSHQWDHLATVAGVVILYSGAAFTTARTNVFGFTCQVFKIASHPHHKAIFQ